MTRQEEFRTILKYLSEGFTTATHWIARQLGRDCAYTRYRLYLLADKGLVEPVCYSGGSNRWWKITEAGVKSLKDKSS